MSIFSSDNFDNIMTVMATHQQISGPINKVDLQTWLGLGSTGALLVESGAASKISALSAAGALAGTELVPIVQAGATVQTTAQAIANLAGATAAILVETGSAAKISAMSAASALAGTETLAIVQSAANAKATVQSVANLAQRYEAKAAKPLVADFTWSNQLSSTATDTSVGISIVPNIHSGDSMNVLKKAAPAFPFDIYTRFSWVAPSINFSEIGLVCINSSNGRLCKVTLIFDGTPFQWDIQTWPSLTGAINASASLKAMTLEHWWMRMNVTSTVMTFYASPDGFAWLQIAQQNISTYVTAAGGALDQVGVIFQAPQDNTHSFLATLNCWDTAAPT